MAELCCISSPCPTPLQGSRTLSTMCCWSLAHCWLRCTCQLHCSYCQLTFCRLYVRCCWISSWTDLGCGPSPHLPLPTHRALNYRYTSSPSMSCLPTYVLVFVAAAARCTPSLGMEPCLAPSGCASWGHAAGSQWCVSSCALCMPRVTCVCCSRGKTLSKQAASA